jgi:hypothetical protein
MEVSNPTTIEISKMKTDIKSKNRFEGGKKKELVMTSRIFSTGFFS